MSDLTDRLEAWKYEDDANIVEAIKYIKKLKEDNARLIKHCDLLTKSDYVPDGLERIKKLEDDLEWTYDIIGDLPREWRKLFEAAYEKEVSDD